MRRIKTKRWCTVCKELTTHRIKKKPLPVAHCTTCKRTVRINK